MSSSKYRVSEDRAITAVSAEQVIPIVPIPQFHRNTAHIRVVQGGFMDDADCWHQAPKKIKEAVRLNGIWYWACRIRDNHGKMLISKDLLLPCAEISQ